MLLVSDWLKATSRRVYALKVLPAVVLKLPVLRGRRLVSVLPSLLCLSCRNWFSLRWLYSLGRGARGE